ncbi:MAG: histidine kinase [Ferruginibacter sp.]
MLSIKAANKKITLVILLLYSVAAYTQSVWIDSVKKVAAFQMTDTNKVFTLNSISDFYTLTEPDSAFVYAQQALALAEKLNFDKGKFWAIVSTNKALYMLGNYALELSFAFKAYPLGQKLNDLHAVGWSMGMLGDCYFNLGDYPTALMYYRRVKQLVEHNSMDDLFSIYSGLVPVFVHLHQYDSALFYAKKGYALQSQNPALNQPDANGYYAKAMVYRFLGEAFAATENLDSALYYYHLSIPYTEKGGIDMNKIDVYNGMADVHRKMGRLDSATWYAKKVTDKNLPKKYPASYLRSANTLAAIYELQHIPDSTLKYLRLAYSINDSLFNRDKTIAIQNIFFNEKEKEKDIAAATARLQDRYTAYFIIALFVILLVAAGIVTRNKRIRQLQLIRNSIADDLHDDIGSTLSSISIMSELAKEKSPQALPLLTSIEESTWAIQENMSDIVWTIKPGNDRFENILFRMELFAMEILEAKNINLEFNSDPSLVVTKLAMKQRKNFYLFFKEVINNAAKHSGANKVSVVLSRKDHQITMTIGDDGKGFDTSHVFVGNGMGSLKKRAAELNAYFNITSHVNCGTTVQLCFKIT